MNKRTVAAFRLLSLGILAVLANSCLTRQAIQPQSIPAAAPELAKAQALYEQGRYREAMIECIDLARADPVMPGLPALQDKIVTRLSELRQQATALNVGRTNLRMEEDADREKTVPETYRLRQPVEGETAPLRTDATSMEEALQKPVTIHLDGVGLADFILAIGESDDINIIADDMETDATMTLHADNVPLAEVLEYVERNLGVTFSMGQNLLWATASEESGPVIPLETRIYRLRKGLISTEIGDGSTSQPDINLVETIRRFVPEPEGTDLLFDAKAHVLIVKNTRQNLAKVEDIIEALDVCPPQILIEARFITTSVDDLRELGIDWLLNSSLGVTKKNILEDGAIVRRNETQVDGGAKIEFVPFANAAQGLNMTYQGLLTEPMFQAVLHALDQSGDARTLSVPKVTTINNREAKIRIGEDFRYFEEYDVQSTPGRISGNNATTYDSVLVPVGTPTLEELGIELTVTPSVGADMRAITLRLAPEISSFKEWVEYEVATRNQGRNQNFNNQNNNNNNQSATNETSLLKLPIFSRSLIETEVVVQSGETVVMGGLINSSEQQLQQRVPFLASLPILGRLFQHDNIEETKQNLLIFVTATLLSDRGESLIPIDKARNGTFGARAYR